MRRRPARRVQHGPAGCAAYTYITSTSTDLAAPSTSTCARGADPCRSRPPVPPLQPTRRNPPSQGRRPAGRAGTPPDRDDVGVDLLRRVTCTCLRRSRRGSPPALVLHSTGTPGWSDRARSPPASTTGAGSARRSAQARGSSGRQREGCQEQRPRRQRTTRQIGAKKGASSAATPAVADSTCGSSTSSPANSSTEQRRPPPQEQEQQQRIAEGRRQHGRANASTGQRDLRVDTRRR